MAYDLGHPCEMCVRQAAADFFDDLAELFEEHAVLPAESLALGEFRNADPEGASAAGLARAGDFSEVGGGVVHVFKGLI